MSDQTKYIPGTLEKTQSDFWEAEQTYQYSADSDRQKFVIDTPPPTVSGSLHIGHVFSYTQTDLIARYQRMCGRNVFYPMGCDDNGLPTERRVQNYFGIKCNPAAADQAQDWQPNFDYDAKKDQILEVSRKDFIKACKILTELDEKAYEQNWRRLGLSVDWNQSYATIDDHSRTISQLSFLDLYSKSEVYNQFAPTMWDTDFQSAIAQAEIEDREKGSAYQFINFTLTDSTETFEIATTRPELLSACVAVVAHPEDERYRDYFGKTALTPLFFAPVPILASEHADPEKGTGIMMVCTFGDQADVDWWKQSDLPAKSVINTDGRIVDQRHRLADPNSKQNLQQQLISLAPELADTNYQQIAGLYINQARKKVVELLSQPGSLSYKDQQAHALARPEEKIMHPVKFYEKGDRPLEFVQTRQWFVRTVSRKEELLAQAEKINWQPAYMQSRYNNWVSGLNQDWCISRQRYFGVAFPVWYKIDAQGNTDYQSPILPGKAELPVDPMADVPAGYQQSQRDQPGGFSGDPDVMDTWATSALTPQLSSHWGLDEKRHEELFPADLRPQAHEIIRTWAFYTIVKSLLHEQSIPWKNIMISGWVLDPERKKMSKSKGNVVTPESLFDQYSADAIRYWSARATLGADTAVDEAVFKNGHKLVNKLYNAANFVQYQMQRIEAAPADYAAEQITTQLDLALVSKLTETTLSATKSFDKFDYAGALKATEEFFWDFCDNYLELIKVRAYADIQSPERDSALATLSLCLNVCTRLFAPFIPFVTEDIWQRVFTHQSAENSSIHTSPWPAQQLPFTKEKPKYASAYPVATSIIGKVRGEKTAARKSLKWEISALQITCSEQQKLALATVQDDLLHAGNIRPDGLSFNIIADNSEPQISLTFNEEWSPKSV